VVIRPGDYVERTITALSQTLEHSATADALSRQPGLLQSLDPRTKVIGIMIWLIAAVTVPETTVTLAIFLLGALLALVSGISLRQFAWKAWGGVFLFTAVMALPAIFLTPGPAVGHVPLLDWPMTAPGLSTALRLVLRAVTATTLATILTLTTPWPHLLKALRVLRLPPLIIMILGMTQRYLFLLVRIALGFFEGRRSRLVGPLKRPQQRHLAISTSGVLLGKTMDLGEDVFLAMQSRGFRGGTGSLDEFRMKPRDGWALAFFATVGALAFWQGFR